MHLAGVEPTSLRVLNERYTISLKVLIYSVISTSEYHPIYDKGEHSHANPQRE